MPTRDCPMCGEPMKLIERETADNVPGNDKPTITKVIEWLCAECEYFEDDDFEE